MAKKTPPTQVLQVDQKYALLFLQQLIRIPSVNPAMNPDSRGEYRIARYLGELMEYFGMEVSYQDLDKGRMNVIGLLKGTGEGKTLMLNGHTDTVGVEGMRISPYMPSIIDGKLYGRGALDMKSGLAAQILAAKALIESRIRLKGDLIIACVADEEHKSLGTEALVSTYTADAAIVTEPTNLKIGTTHKGFVWAKASFKGKAAHGSRPEEGVDAILKAGKFLTALDNWENVHLPKYQHPLLGRASLHAAIIRGGEAISIYPSHCEVELERRTLPGESPDLVELELTRILSHLAERDPHFKYQLSVYFSRPPLVPKNNELILGSLSQAYQQVFHTSPETEGISFWTDAALLGEAGMPTLVFGPSGEGLHAAEEYVTVDSFLSSIEVLAHTIIHFCGAA